MLLRSWNNGSVLAGLRRNPIARAGMARVHFHGPLIAVALADDQSSPRQSGLGAAAPACLGNVRRRAAHFLVGDSWIRSGGVLHRPARVEAKSTGSLRYLMRGGGSDQFLRRNGTCPFLPDPGVGHLAGNPASHGLDACGGNRGAGLWLMRLLADSLVHPDHADQPTLGRGAFEAFFRRNRNRLRNNFLRRDVLDRHTPAHSSVACVHYRSIHLHFRLRSGLALLRTLRHRRRIPAGPGTGSRVDPASLLLARDGVETADATAAGRGVVVRRLLSS